MAEQPLWALGEAPAFQQDVGSQARRTVPGSVPHAACTGGVALFADSCDIQVEPGLAAREAKSVHGSFCGLLRLQHLLWCPALQALRGRRAQAGAAGRVATPADVVILIKTLSTAAQTLALAQCQRKGTGGTVRGQRSLTGEARIVTSSASSMAAWEISIWAL